ncbi:leucine--tRNA ligase [Candidatus Shapirobacteria bacterium]|nr:MAG: leucine--tRNA ligase [Candidatus Shapirobacteria bacterium]
MKQKVEEKIVKREEKWSKYWEENRDLYKAGGKKGKKKYVLVEFPYPSGSGLHVGHAFSFTGADVYARFMRMKGFDVLFPMGWDGFGLPTENYAIKMKRKPQEVTKENTDMFRKQMKRLAYSFDWDREVNTTDPSYYKWTQWIFLKLFEKGLAYKKEMPINWCPSCKIGLANEEVVDGKCERCGHEVSQRNLSQWVVKITDYADRLIEGLKKTDFIEKVKSAQINWIGKSSGAKLKFKLKDKIGEIEELEVFTTRPDTLYGATFMVVAPEHKLVKALFSNASKIASERSDDERIDKIREYVKQASKKSDLERAELAKEKTGVDSGLMAINPVNGQEIPIWISDFVLSSYGTGAIMAVPAHDERDFAFAKKFGLKIVPVIKGAEDHDFEESAYTEVDRGEMINSGDWNGLLPQEAIKKAIDFLKDKGIGDRADNYHLRDWIFSRQHYWGEPIPMVKCPKCGWVGVKEEDLPIELPEVEAYEPTETGESPLAKMIDWLKTTCPKCGGPASRETDTMPNWAGSDWYFLRYTDPENDSQFASMTELKKWCPVDVYIGGDEHNTLHLLYSRFIYQFLYDLGVVPQDYPEPYIKRISHGVILGPDNQRMSKSRGNVIIPESVTKQYGVDVLRCYLMFMGPFDGVMAWNEKTLMGVKRFLDKFERKVLLAVEAIDKGERLIEDEIFLVKLNQTIKGVADDLEKFKYNTAVAKLMELVNVMGINNEKLGISKESLRAMIRLLAPLAPYLAEDLWAKVGEGSVHASSWPEVEKRYLVEDEIVVPVAVNGKRRAEIRIQKGLAKEEVLKRAKEVDKIGRWLEGKEIKREIYVEGRMVNLVVG